MRSKGSITQKHLKYPALMQGTSVISHQCKSQPFTYRNCLAKQYLQKVKRRPPCTYQAKYIRLK